MAKKIEPDELSENLQKAFNVIGERLVNQFRKNFTIAGNQIYNNIKASYETCTLRNEIAPNQSVTKIIPTGIEIHETTESMILVVTAPTLLETRILYMKSHGTGLGVDPDVLKYFGVTDEGQQGIVSDGEKEDEVEMSNWYFEPTSEHMAFLKQYKILFKAKSGA